MSARRGRLLWAAGVAAVAVAAVVGTAIATGGGRQIRVGLEGYQEVPAVSTSATGDFRARIVRGGQAIDYTLSYGALEGAVQQAHIHFGQKKVNGGISAFLCSNLPSPPPPPNTPACPTGPATVTGTIDAADVIGPPGQGIAAGELGELVRAIESGVAYANVHSAKFPSGEIRGQLRSDGRGR